MTDFGVSTREENYKMTPDHNWKQVFSSKDSSSERRFPNLLPGISLLLFLPFSNAPAERGFSHVKLVKKCYQIKKKAETTDAIIKTRFWLLNQEKTASEVNFPNNLILNSQGEFGCDASLKSLRVMCRRRCMHSLNY